MPAFIKIVFYDLNKSSVREALFIKKNKDRWMKNDFIAKAKKLNELAGSIGVTMAQLSIGWCLTNPNVTTAISSQMDDPRFK